VKRRIGEGAKGRERIEEIGDREWKNGRLEHWKDGRESWSIGVMGDAGKGYILKERR